MMSIAARNTAGLASWDPTDPFVVAKTIGLLFQRAWSESRKPELGDFPDFLSDVSRRFMSGLALL